MCTRRWFVGGWIARAFAGACAFAGVVAVAGCGASQVRAAAPVEPRAVVLPAPAPPPVVHAPPPPWDRVLLVGEVPPADCFRLVGRVEGISAVADFVEATDAARIDIRMQALRRGATLVKIDTMKPPPDLDRTGTPHVLLVGRAYAPILAARVVRHEHRRQWKLASVRP